MRGALEICLLWGLRDCIEYTNGLPLGRVPNVAVPLEHLLRYMPRQFHDGPIRRRTLA